LTRPEVRDRARTVSMLPSTAPPRTYTSFMDLEHPTSELRPTLKRLTSLPTDTKNISKKWSSFIEISAVV
jgi:hypothetical protein